jgi:uncharacterized protein (TIGR03083 family)
MHPTPMRTVTSGAALDHNQAMELQSGELERAIALLTGLRVQDWSAPTECPGWDVLTMYRHVLGACEAGASMRENVRQLRRARTYRRRNGGPLEAALSAVQIEDRAGLDAEQVLQGLISIAPRTIRGRRRIPGFVRRRAKLSVDGPVHERWTLGYLVDTIYLRDLWMHRIDVCRATSVPVELSAEHDGRIVADVVAEWARRHGRPYRLCLTGPAGATFASTEGSAQGTESLTLDAIDFCRTLAGREAGNGLLATVVPF